MWQIIHYFSCKVFSVQITAAVFFCILYEQSFYYNNDHLKCGGAVEMWPAHVTVRFPHVLYWFILCLIYLYDLLTLYVCVYLEQCNIWDTLCKCGHFCVFTSRCTSGHVALAVSCCVTWKILFQCSACAQKPDESLWNAAFSCCRC